MDRLDFDTYYHIYNHANGDDNLFREEKNYPFFLEKYHQHIDSIADTIAWCLMPNHFHLLIKIKREEEIASTFPKFGTLEKSEAKTNFLSKRFANFFSSYTQSFNKVYGRRGSLFLKNFKRSEVGDMSYLQNLILYVHLNPVKHGFVKEATEWAWTSYEKFPETNPELFDMVFQDYASYARLHSWKSDIFAAFNQVENALT